MLRGEGTREEREKAGVKRIESEDAHTKLEVGNFYLQIDLEKIPRRAIRHFTDSTGTPHRLVTIKACRRAKVDRVQNSSHVLTLDKKWWEPDNEKPAWLGCAWVNWVWTEDIAPTAVRTITTESGFTYKVEVELEPQNEEEDDE